MNEQQERRECCIEIDKRLSKLEWGHNELEKFSKQMHSDQLSLKQELNKISATLSQIKWMVVGILIAYLITKGNFTEILMFLP